MRSCLKWKIEYSNNVHIIVVWVYDERLWLYRIIQNVRGIFFTNWIWAVISWFFRSYWEQQKSTISKSVHDRQNYQVFNWLLIRTIFIVVRRNFAKILSMYARGKKKRSSWSLKNIFRNSWISNRYHFSIRQLIARYYFLICNKISIDPNQVRRLKDGVRSSKI